MIFLPLLLVVVLAYGWMLHAYLHYRSGRQDELLHLLAATAESGAPLAPAVRAYLRDRPRRGWRAFWAAVLLFFVVPGYYWVWHRRHSYDRKLARVARRLEQGEPLYQALRKVPGVAPGATALAVAVGESTGRLALSLRRSAGGRLTIVWLEAVPRLLYPIALLIFMNGVLGFWMLYLLPKMLRIFDEFGVELPALTLQLSEVGTTIEEHGWVISQGLVAAVVLGTLVVFSPAVRWYVPVLGRLYRMSVQSRVLKMLGVLLEAGKPLPEALAVLADSGALPGGMGSRLDAARRAAEQGEPLPEALSRGGLLPASMAPLVRAAERARNLPWALTELGEALAARAARRARQLSLAVFPAAVVAVGVLVGLMVAGMFLPLVKLISELG